MYVCLCQGVTDTQIREAVIDGASSLREVNSILGTASQCGKCGVATRDIINQTLAARNEHEVADLFYEAG